MEAPKVSPSQRIGLLGKKAFTGGIPDGWHEESTPTQGSDFGFDYSMWLEELGQMTGRFAVQLKTEVNPTPSGGDNPFYTVELTPAQCNMYVQDGQPVMAVHVALEGDSSRGATLRYVWITDEIHKRLGSRLQFDTAKPAEMSFRVPSENILAHDLDVSEYVQAHWSVNRLVGKLRSPHGTAALSTVTAMTAEALGQIGKAKANQLSTWMTRAEIESDAPWFTQAAGSLPDDIRRLGETITRGDTDEADRLIESIGRRCHGSDSDLLAEYAFQRGRRASVDTDSRNALLHYAHAHDVAPASPRYLAALLEATFRESLDAKAIPQPLIERAEQHDHPAVTFQLVRIAALAGESEKVSSLLGKLSGAHRYRAEMLHRIVAGDWAGAVEFANQVLVLPDVDLHAQSFIAVLRARAQLHVVLAGQEEIPAGGHPEFDVDQARRLHEYTLDALRCAQRVGWPANSEMTLDPALAVTVMFGPDAEVLTSIRDYARKRPSISDAQEALSRIAAVNDEPSVAIEALERVPSDAPQRTERLVMLHAEQGNDGEAVRLAISDLLPQPHTHESDVAMLAAVGAAVRSGAIIEERALRLYLSEPDADPGVQGLLDYLTANWSTGQRRNDAALAQLVKHATEGAGNDFLLDNSMLHLKPNRPEDVPRIIKIGRMIQQRRSLNESESGKFAAALLESGEIDDALQFSARASAIFPRSENLGVTHAVALDRMGQAAAASAVLGRFASTTRIDVLQARSRLYLRAGQVDEAIVLIQQALSNCDDRRERVRLLRLMATLQSATDPTAYFETAWRLGEVVDPSDEEEEACFLCHFTMAAMGMPEPDAERVSRIHTRVEAFSSRFPSSMRFRVGHLPEDDKPEDLLARIRSLSGMSEEDFARHQRAVRLGERAGAQIPLAVRPRRFAPFAQDVVHLFLITVAGKYRGEPSRLWLPDSAASTRPMPAPIIDLTTLLALVELDLFDALFEIWTAIAIPQASLEHLSELQLSPLLGVTGEHAGKASAAIRRWHARILQPHVPGEETYPTSESMTVANEVSAGRHRYFTVDQAARVWTKSEGEPITLWDFLAMLRERGATSDTHCSQVRLRVASWNTMNVPLAVRDVALAMRGQPSDALDPCKPLYHCITTFLRDALNFVPVAEVIVELSQQPSDENALRTFVAVVYREGLMLRAMRSGKDLSATRWTALAAALVANALRPQGNSALEAMRRAWYALKECYRQYDQVNEGWEALYDELGSQLARVLDRVVKSAGLLGMAIEEDIRVLVFSLAETGTSERDRLETAYFMTTAAINE